MIRVVVDREKCQTFGQCTLEADDIFRIDGSGDLDYVAEVEESRLSAVENAADVCPTQAISVLRS
jgi:ferredoxin